MRNVKRNMPVDPETAKHFSQAALGVRTANPDLAARSKYSMDADEHPTGIQGVLQDIRQNRDIEERARTKLFQKFGVDVEPGVARDGSGELVEFEPFDLKSIAGVDAQAAAFIAANIEKTPGAARKMKRDIPVELGPETIDGRGQESLSQPGIQGAGLAAEVVMRFVESFERVRF